MKKKVLLIEDNIFHMNNTIEILSELKEMYVIKGECFCFMSQDGDDMATHENNIVEFIKNNINNFDILMIDMLLAGEDEDNYNPVGLKVIDRLKDLLKDKLVIEYTEMTNRELDSVRQFNKSNKISKTEIVSKPNNFWTLDSVCPCNREYKEIKEKNGINCDLGKCSIKKHLICAMSCIYHKYRGDTYGNK